MRQDGHDINCSGLTDAGVGSGSTACAFLTVQKGVDSAIAPGDTVMIHHGTYFESVSVRVSGTEGNLTAIRGFPGEAVIIDAGEQAFRTAGNTDWELVDPSLGEYRSVTEHPGSRVYGYIEGIPGYEDGRVALVPYIDTRDELGGGLTGFDMFRATTDAYVDPTTPFYVGPGIWLGKACGGGSNPGAACEISSDCLGGGTCDPTNRIHIRLSKTAALRYAESRYGAVLNGEDADPRGYSIILSLASETVRVYGSYLRFDNLTFNPSLKTILLESGSHHVTFDGVTVWVGDRAIEAGPAIDPPHDLTVTRSKIYGDSPYWIFWSDSKNPPFPALRNKGTDINLENGAHDVEISYNHIRGGMDGIGTNDSEYNVSIHHNRVENLKDDAFEIEGTSDVGRIAVYENYIANSLTGFAPGQASPVFTGPVFFYRNVVSLLRDHPVNRAVGINGWNGGLRYGHEYVFKQHSPNTFYYHNTVILLNSRDHGIHVVPGDPGEQDNTYVFNNIYSEVNGTVQGPYLTGAGQIVDHDLYWKMNPDDDEPLAGGYDTIPDLRAATALELGGIGDAPRMGTDPQFKTWGLAFDASVPTRWTIGADQEVWSTGDFLLGAGSPAIGTGRPLPTHPTFGTLPDSRASQADLGALPSSTSASEWDIFPFNQAWQGPFTGPDLAETQLLNPPQIVAAGNSFSVTDRVSNPGSAAAGSSMTRYYLSTDRVKSGPDQLLTGSRPVPALGVSESSTGTVTITVPKSTPAGTYYLLACADDPGSVSESDEQNNCRSSAGQVQIVLPDLVETAVSDPPGISEAGITFSITDIVSNLGLGTSKISATLYYLSTDATKSSSDTSLRGSRFVPALAPGMTSTGTVTVTVLSGTAAGTYYLLACADGFSAVLEGSEANNCRASARQVQITRPDLVETAVSNPPGSAVAGNTFSVTDTTSNQGAPTSRTSATLYYLSTDATKSSSDAPLTGSRFVPGLATGATSTGTVTVTVSLGTPAGTYYLLACADGFAAVPETDDANNCRASTALVQITVRDLVETAVTNPPGSATAGSGFSVTDTATNQGSASAGSSTTRYYLSLDTLKDGSDTLLSGTRSVSSLSAGALSTGTVTVTIPSATAEGNYYLLACADDTSAVAEGDETNNCRASANRIQVTVPDLVETAVANPPATAPQGSSFSTTDTASNHGSGASGSSTTRYYLSLDTLKNSSDKLLSGARSVSGLAPGASSTGTTTVTISSSTAAGSYYLLACADDTGSVPENNDANNCLASTGRVQVTVPDLVETAVTNPPATARQASSFSVTDTVSNQGAAASGSSTTRYYLSTDTLKSGSDLLLSGPRSVPGLAPGASSTGTATVSIPSGTAAGSYYLLACADDAASITESNESNNCRASAAQVLVSIL